MKKKENCLISFEENGKFCNEILAKQPPITFEQALAQVKRIEAESKVKEENKKRWNYKK